SLGCRVFFPCKCASPTAEALCPPPAWPWSPLYREPSWPWREPSSSSPEPEPDTWGPEVVSTPPSAMQPASAPWCADLQSAFPALKLSVATDFRERRALSPGPPSLFATGPPDRRARRRELVPPDAPARRK